MRLVYEKLQYFYKIIMRTSQSNIIYSKNVSPFRINEKFNSVGHKKIQSIIIENKQTPLEGKEARKRINKSIQQQISKAKQLCQSQKLKRIGPKPNITIKQRISLFTRVKEKSQIINNQQFIKNIEIRSFQNKLKSHSKLFILSSKSLLVSPKKKSLVKTQEKSLERKKEIEHLNQARYIESFIDEEQEKTNISIVQHHGFPFLNCLNKKPFRQTLQEFKMIKFLDQGNYGKVYLAQNRKNNMIVSIKSIYRNRIKETFKNQLIRELKIHSFLNHPNIVKLYGFVIDQESIHMILEPCLGKNLYENIQDYSNISEKLVKIWIRQVCIAIDYMHKNDILHRDLKPQNILLHENIIKICDFGWTIHSPLLRKTQCGTPLYNAPEIVQNITYSNKVDIWGIGMLTYQLIYGTIPFEIRQEADINKIIQDDIYYSKKVVVSEAARDFMKGCLQKNPIDRYTIKELLDHQFLIFPQRFRLTSI